MKVRPNHAGCVLSLSLKLVAWTWFGTFIPAMHTVAGKEKTEVSSYEDRQAILSACIVGVSLIVGLAAGGYFVGQGSMRFKSETRTVTVKGLVEKKVKSDQAVWVLHFSGAVSDRS
jgi:hypothetical protein